MASIQIGIPNVEMTAVAAQAHVVQNASQSPRPSLHLIQDRREYLEKCVPIYKLALRGDWKEAKRMIDADKRLLNAAITKEMKTLLHVVAGTNHVAFVEELVELLDPKDLELQDSNGNTAFCFVAASGNLRIADIMIQKNESLPKIRGGEEVTPLYMAALQGRSDMTRHLYALTMNTSEGEDWDLLFFRCIHNGLYAILQNFADIALEMLQKHPKLAFDRNEHKETALHVLARKSHGFSCRCHWYLQNPVINSKMKPTPFLELVERLWSMLLNEDHTETEMRIFISKPSQIIFDATEIGNFHFVAALMRSYPDLIWEVDGKNRSIIHMAVLHRHSSIFSLIHELRSFTDFIATFQDDEGNNILHYAAKLTPPNQLSIISGEALQMTHDLLWFEEVKKMMLLSDIEKKNSNGKTPGELFAEEHKELLTKAESWTKNTAKCCILVSTLITTGVFTATFMIPGGNNKNTGTPNYLNKPAFLIFAVADAIALIFSSASILIFLSILMSSYAEECFKSLPFKLLFGLVAQIISITSMMVAFSVAFFIAYSHGLTWVPNFISVLSFLPIPLFHFLLFPLWSDIIHSSYFCMSLFWPRK
ncbi:ankyrin repeat-containing protein NPR4-like [Abrus precatorius]|uniref:Ankyrin repeat-containing protein NPR4-like n=1 Tax=Abrus precatorius TaxID=3816 RepID=A0A8B8JW65_ABRPR|nr:ankyrin repeat-containing protein NPR4-like [Abrus precatorius]